MRWVFGRQHGVPGSGTTVSITIDRSLVDQVYPTLNGVISTRDQFAWVIRAALTPVGAQFAVSGTTDGYALLSVETSAFPDPRSRSRARVPR
ncbi:hypothetical protein HGP14_23465 [Rhizobium sp. P32RR-XVIII]|uniref:hypothetical protein n=1 Tax=Rhizobium sp. P32RR-XVIII TaxID=2726738 RepID=UPI0014578585|nr:hypothetical protein [Rhizobium sp. P32RR-XVIII]NLS06284.1 hypothetical protein [Rhizobium sp. P32RR-XVIII]